MISLKGRSFLKLLDFTPEEIEGLLNAASELKSLKKAGIPHRYLEGKNVALVFEKTSTRTRCSFEVAAADLGMHAVYLDPKSSQIGKKESIPDTARVLGRMFDGIEYRGFGQELAESLAYYSGKPVWNGLTNEFHPTQILADFLTIREHLGYFPDGDLVSQCLEIAKETGATLEFIEDQKTAVTGADVIYTDVWVSMGEPDEVWAERIRDLMPYQVNKALMDMTGKDALFMHCLPAFHDLKTEIGREMYEKFGYDCLEVTDEVFESEASVVFDEAENRLHTIKAVMATTLI